MNENGGTGVRLTLQKYDPEDGENTIKYHRFPFQNGLTDDQVEAQNMARASFGGEPMGAEEAANLRRYIPSAEIAVLVNASLVQMGWPPLDAAQVAHIEAIRIVSCGGSTDLPAKIADGVGGALKELMGKVAQRQADDAVELAARTIAAEETAEAAKAETAAAQDAQSAIEQTLTDTQAQVQELTAQLQARAATEG